MRTLVLYIRQMFCDHEWEKEEGIDYVLPWGTNYIPSGPIPAIVSQTSVVSLLCLKCGWHRSFSKFRRKTFWA